MHAFTWYKLIPRLSHYSGYGCVVHEIIGKLNCDTLHLHMYTFKVWGSCIRE